MGKHWIKFLQISSPEPEIIEILRRSLEHTPKNIPDYIQLRYENGLPECLGGRISERYFG